MEGLTPEEQEALEEKRLARVISSPRSKTGGVVLSPRAVVAPKPAAAAAPASPRSGGGPVPAWKLAQMEREKAEQDRIEAEKKKKLEAAAAIAERQAKLGADADSGSDIPTYTMSQQPESPRSTGPVVDSPYATTSVLDQAMTGYTDPTVDRAEIEEARLMRLISKTDQ